MVLFAGPGSFSPFDVYSVHEVRADKRVIGELWYENGIFIMRLQPPLPRRRLFAGTKT